MRRHCLAVWKSVRYPLHLHFLSTNKYPEGQCARLLSEDMLQGGRCRRTDIFVLAWKVRKTRKSVFFFKLMWIVVGTRFGRTALGDRFCSQHHKGLTEGTNVAGGLCFDREFAVGVV